MSAPGYLERVVLGEDRGLLSWIIRILLFPLSLLYRAGLAVFLGIYALGLRKKYKLNVPVISVGNLTFGGTGKTPAVQKICRILDNQRKKVVILSRGHNGTAKGCVIVSDGLSILSNADESGDEPMLLAASLPGVPVIVGKDRRESGRLACSRFDPDVIVLDDGLQYWQLHRDNDIVVLDASKPFGSGYVMPMGDLREPVSGLKRADIVLLTNTQELDDSAYDKILKTVSRMAPNAGIYRSAHTPVCINKVDSSKSYALEWIKGREILAFSGIGKPSAFTDMLESLGALVINNLVFQDHYRYTVEDIERINNEYNSCGAKIILTTEKDAARIGENCSIPNLYTLSIELEIYEEKRFTEHISNRLN